MKIICFGDSNTWGYDPRGYFGGRYDDAWPELLAGKLNCPVINQGENGREIPTRAVVFPDDADLLIVMLGTNDLLQGAAPDTVTDRMEQFLRSLNVKSILLIAPPPMQPGQWVTGQRLIQDSVMLTECYRELAKRVGIQFADAGRWSIPLAWDGVHITEAGHMRFAEELYEYLNNPPIDDFPNIQNITRRYL